MHVSRAKSNEKLLQFCNIILTDQTMSRPVFAEFSDFSDAENEGNLVIDETSEKMSSTTPTQVENLNDFDLIMPSFKINKLSNQNEELLLTNQNQGGDINPTNQSEKLSNNENDNKGVVYEDVSEDEDCFIVGVNRPVNRTKANRTVSYQPVYSPSLLIHTPTTSGARPLFQNDRSSTPPHGQSPLTHPLLMTHKSMTHEESEDSYIFEKRRPGPPLAPGVPKDEDLTPTQLEHRERKRQKNAAAAGRYRASMKRKVDEARAAQAEAEQCAKVEREKNSNILKKLKFLGEKLKKERKEMQKERDFVKNSRKRSQIRMQTLLDENRRLRIFVSQKQIAPRYNAHAPVSVQAHPRTEKFVIKSEPMENSRPNFFVKTEIRDSGYETGPEAKRAKFTSSVLTCQQ